MRKAFAVASVVLAMLVGSVAAARATFPTESTPPSNVLSTLDPATTPIKHVVVVMQENHSFDNVLGKLCVDDQRCDGTLTGTLYGGTRIALHQAPDIVPAVVHRVSSQVHAIDKGKMDGFSRIVGCDLSHAYGCYSYYDESQIPALAALARQYVISDASFSPASAPSWGGHFAMVSPSNGWVNGWNATFAYDGFSGENPVARLGTAGPGWGCDSHKDSLWRPTRTAIAVYEPSCVPSADGSGPYRASPVAHVSTIMDSLDRAGLSWKIYGTLDPTDSGYIWNVCPTFADCVKKQQTVVQSRASFAADAATGQLPAVSFLIPDGAHSQHNGDSMMRGDNWIAQNVNAVMNGPDWNSTAIFITYDDCGCFYDHVNPNTPTTGLGIRVPMVVVSPYARPRFTDSHATSSTSGILSFIEHNFGLPAIGNESSYYDYSQSFDLSQTPIAPTTLTQHSIPTSSLHTPLAPDSTDPT
jgi:phospholipase C